MGQFNTYPAPTTPLSGSEELLLAQSGNTKTATVQELFSTTVLSTAFASPPAIGGTAPAAGVFTTLTAQNLVFRGGLGGTLVTTTTGTTLVVNDLTSTFISRSGPTANFTDTTDTAVNIIAVIPDPINGMGFFFQIQNNTVYTMTLAAGTGVTVISYGATIAAGAVRNYVAIITSSTTLTIENMGSGTI